MKYLSRLSIRLVFAALLLVCVSGLQAQRVGIGTLNPQARLHVTGSFRADTLSGPDNRVVRTNASGDVDGIPSGNTGEILTQTPVGPVWSPLTLSTGAAPGGGINGCDSCATVWSNLSGSTMTWGNCARYCETLVEGGYDDWRIPTFEEATRLFGSTPSSSDYIWTLTAVSSQYNSTSTGRYLCLQLSNGTWINSVTATTGGSVSCKCVR